MGPRSPRSVQTAAVSIAAVLLCPLPLGCSGGNGAAKPDAARPNIVLVLVDDLGHGDVGYNGSEIRTPHLDRLAGEGLILERYYASSACTPSRAQLLTGLYAPRVGLENNINFHDEHGLAQAVTTLPELLSEVGYRTHLVGKWHLGHRAEAHHPLRHGFDHFYGHLSGWVDYFSHERNGELDWYRDREPLVEEGYTTELLTREAVSIVRQAADEERPLFLLLSYNAPHFPLHVAPGKEQRPGGSPERQQYRTMVEALDDGLGALAEALEETGQDHRTLLFFASDNGGIASKGGSNGNLRGSKFTMYEGGLRVPAFLRWPGRLAPGRSPQVTTNLDLLPTLCTAAGMTAEALPPGLDGLDLWTQLGTRTTLPRKDLSFYLHHQAHWKAALLRGRNKLVHTRRKDGSVELELFDLIQDARERDDLTTSRPQQIEKLRAGLEQRAAQVGFGPEAATGD